ncbi:MAG: hydantoinase/oxoprolinase N-terminal domain-containing protein, partial [Bdellovibrionota bacterium]|nr:hydantoinase/oxoprolinase N-terminal domain-containing protein [Bdellovibrionota bacterium]
VRKPPPLYSKSLGVKERVNSRGEILIPIEDKDIHNKLILFQSLGIKNIVVAFLHSLKNKKHEKRVYEIAKYMGF